MIKKYLKELRSSFYKFKFRNKKVRFRDYVEIDSKCYLEGYNSISFNTTLHACSVGIGSYIGEDVKFRNVKIGKFCSLGSRIYNTAGRHPTSLFVTTHPAFFSKRTAAGFTFSNYSKFNEVRHVEDGPNLVEIGNDVWIGDDVVILDGIKIGDGAIIGTGAVVTKNIEPYSINVGIPAKAIKNRFEKCDIDYLINLKWWDRDIEWLRENHHLFDNIEIFKKQYSKDA